MPPDVQPETSEPEPPKKNRPKATRLRQQKLPAWQPILTASTVIPTVFCVGIIFISIGIALLLAGQAVKEKIIMYNKQCGSQPVCNIAVTLDEGYSGDVFFYYYLENVYQNQYRYVKSRNDQQYLGVLDSTTDCKPFHIDINTKLPIVPCGAIANSMFNDTYNIIGPSGPVPFTTKGVIWDIDYDRFKNPNDAKDDLCKHFINTTKPPNWRIPICEMEGGLKNVDFIVWMRTAALPNFRKLWRKLNTKVNGYESGLPAGKYNIKIFNNYRVDAFGGNKGFIIATSSWAGGKNSFLGIAYLVVGGIALFLGAVFIFIHIRFGHSCGHYIHKFLLPSK